ncbi:MAG: sigma-70 family RNA polymerase sigma factor [Gemmatimonadetes bacterium]|nr:sigma-70 family RNA polymerase sigma factor [Gemmatimonadota bacterium]
MLSRSEGLDRSEATDRLLPVVYEELRALARARLRDERAGHTLETTALVNEAYLRLVGGDGPPWSGRAHFFHAAARAMRQILVDHARSRNRIKRGAGMSPVSLDEARAQADESDPDEILAVDQALRRLEMEDPRAADVVHLRYYAGLSVKETAQALALSERTVLREWAYAKAWLRDALDEGGSEA